MSETEAKSKVIEFRNLLPSCKYAFKDGTTAVFINHIYHTSDEQEIAELMKEVRSLANQYITGGTEVDQSVLDPLAGLKAKFFEEFKAAQAAEAKAAIDPSNNMGGSKQAIFGALSSEGTDVAAQDQAMATAKSAKAPKVATVEGSTIPVIKA